MHTATATHKQRVLNRILTTLKRDLPATEPEPRPVLEQLLYSICRENAPRERADKAFNALRSFFYDWNEIRVSSARELVEVLAPLPDAEMRAYRIVSLLQEIFETTYAFELESLHKKGLKQAQKQLERYQGANPYAVAYTLQMGLGGHSLPIDAAMHRTLQRLELIDEDATGDALQASLEHLVPKARGPIFAELLSGLAQQFCHESSPTCPRCPMRDVCPAGQRSQKNGQASGRATAKSKVR
jgi:endonuclease III